MSHTHSENDSRIKALEDRLATLEHILRYAIPYSSWPANITWPDGQPPQFFQSEAWSAIQSQEVNSPNLLQGESTAG